MAIEFEGTVDPAGIEVYDPIEQRRLHARTPETVAPEPVGDDRFPFPIGTACTIETSSLIFDQLYLVDVHDEFGRTTHSLDAGESLDLDETTQFIGLSGPMKLYCLVPDSGRLETGIDSIHLSFDEPTTITIGARSLHEQPAGTIRTPDDPESMMRAVSALSSALKTTSPERTWPTLRGHPPLIERGDALEIPSVVQTVDTDVSITVPPTRRDLYTIAPLSFFLGAELVPGERAAIRADEFAYELGVGRRLEDAVAETLKHLFLLDCVVRTEGLYRYELHERAALEADLPFDVADAYDLPLAERLERYLDVPHEVVEPHLPRWPLTAHVPSRPEAVELLPFIVNELGIVRAPRGETIDMEPAAAETARSHFVRSAETARSPVFPEDTGGEIRVVEPDVTDESIEHAWFGGEVPLGASKATAEAYRNQLSRGPRNESIEILLVCNDAAMLEEHDALDGAYGNRDALPFDVRSEFGVPTDDLAALLTEGGYDFFHYIGHATPDGLQCPDGKLDVRTLSSVDVSVFFLNACQSYEQGLALSRRGSFGGVATLGDIVNEYAVEIGETMARLLNLGFPLRAALELAKETSVLGEQYLIVGDGSTDIAQSDGGVPSILKYRTKDEGYHSTFCTYSTKEFKVGTSTSPSIKTVSKKYLSPGEFDPSNISDEELQNYLLWTNVPVLNDGTFSWNTDYRTLEL